MESVILSIPNSEIGFIRALSKKMGWAMEHHRKTELELAIEDVESGKLHEAKDVNDLMEQLSK